MVIYRKTPNCNSPQPSSHRNRTPKSRNHVTLRREFSIMHLRSITTIINLPTYAIQNCATIFSKKPSCLLLLQLEAIQNIEYPSSCASDMQKNPSYRTRKSSISIMSCSVVSIHTDQQLVKSHYHRELLAQKPYSNHQMKPINLNCNST